MADEVMGEELPPLEEVIYGEERRASLLTEHDFQKLASFLDIAQGVAAIRQRQKDEAELLRMMQEKLEDHCNQQAVNLSEFLSVKKEVNSLKLWQKGLLAIFSFIMLLLYLRSQGIIQFNMGGIIWSLCH